MPVAVAADVAFLLPYWAIIGASHQIRAKKVRAFDERLSTQEQIDFGLRAKLLGARLTVERTTIVTQIVSAAHLEIDLS